MNNAAKISAITLGTSPAGVTNAKEPGCLNRILVKRGGLTVRFRNADKAPKPFAEITIWAAASGQGKGRPKNNQIRAKFVISAHAGIPYKNQ